MVVVVVVGGDQSPDVSKVDRVGSLHFHVTNEVHLVWKWCDQVESLIMGPRWEECTGFSF